LPDRCGSISCARAEAETDDGHHHGCESKRRRGKTTTAINLSAALAHRGKRTLLIDLDPQANSTIAFYDAGEISTTMFDVLSDSRVTMATVIKPTKDPMLFLGPGRLALAKLEQVLAGQFDAAFQIERCADSGLKRL